MKFLFLAMTLILADASSCGSNPNAVGVRDYGSVVGRVLDATNNRPVPNALVAVGSLITAYADQQGGFSLTDIPIGSQPVSASAPGYGLTSVTVRVHKGQTTSANYIRLVPVTGGPTVPPPPTPTPSPQPTDVPVVIPSGSPAPAATPTT